LPDGSNANTVSSVDIAPLVASQQLLAPQRSATQMIFPSGDTSTALVEPHVRPSGSLKAPEIVSYGFGRSLVGVADCHYAAAVAGVCARLLALAAATMAAATSACKTRRFCNMESLSLKN
jgi:hypothetical protein